MITNNCNNDKGYFEYSTKYNIKEKLLKRIGIDSNGFKITTLEDLANLQIQFQKMIPFDNTNIILNGYKEGETMDIEQIFSRILDDGLGSYCIHLNLLFGTFLTECGFKIQIVTGKQDSELYRCLWFILHAGNVIEFTDGKLYFIDVGFGFMSPFKPIELGNEIGVSQPSHFPSPSTEYRVIKLHTNQYIFQDRQTADEPFKPIFHFELSPIPFELLDSNSRKYANRGKDFILLIKVFNNGNLILFKEKLVISYNINQTQTIKDQDDENIQKLIRTSEDNNNNLILVKDCNNFNNICNLLFKYDNKNNKFINF